MTREISPADTTTEVSLTINGTEIKSFSGFSISMDIMQLGDPFALTLPNPRGLWTKLTEPGAAVQVRMRNQAVNGNQWALRHTGRIIDSPMECDNTSGSIIQVAGADLGWHLMNEYPQPFLRLEQATFGDLLKWAIDGAPTASVQFVGNQFKITRSQDSNNWGFSGVTSDTEATRKIRLGTIGGRAVQEAQQQDALIIYQAQVEPGQSLGALLIRYAQRFNRLVNVTPDGFIQVFEPNYAQTPLYRINLYREGSMGNSPNNVLRAHVDRSLTTRYSRVTVVGQVVGYQVFDPWKYNPGKFLGTADATGDDALPFVREFTRADGEVWDPKWAPDAAGWTLRRGLYDAFTATYTVRGHWQSYGGKANWWVPDTMCEVHDEVHGLDGNYYVAAVRPSRTMAGDLTEVTLKKPNLLSANFRNVVTGKVS